MGLESGLVFIPCPEGWSRASGLEACRWWSRWYGTLWAPLHPAPRCYECNLLAWYRLTAAPFLGRTALRKQELPVQEVSLPGSALCSPQPLPLRDCSQHRDDSVKQGSETAVPSSQGDTMVVRFRLQSVSPLPPPPQRLGQG